jgi:hypothetical protein
MRTLYVVEERIDPGITRGQCSVFSFQFSVFSTGKIRADSGRYQHGSTTMTRKRWRAKALAERRRRAMQLHLAGFTQEEIADKLGADRSVVCRDLQSARDVCRSGDSADLEVARFTQRLSGNGDRHSTRCMRLRPGTLHPVASPPFRIAIESRGGGRIVERKKDLRPAGRWIRPPTEVVIRYAKQRNLTQFNAI